MTERICSTCQRGLARSVKGDAVIVLARVHVSPATRLVLGGARTCLYGMVVDRCEYSVFLACRIPLPVAVLLLPPLGFKSPD